jgi:hypothetical protein
MEISMNYISITSSLNIGGNYQVSERGICWSTLPNPTLGTNSMSSGSGPGIYTITVSGLPLETVYYIRSYAIHPFGIAYSPAISIKTPASCGNSFEVFHDSTNGVAPLNKTVVYGTTYMSGLPNKCFITRNLGASRIGFNVDDTTEASAGWYWQFNTRQGYKHTGTRRTPEISWPPPVTENSNWDQAKDPCTNELGVDWRLPTYSELNTLLLTNNWLNSLDLFNSALKLHPAGALNYDDGDKLEYFGGIYSNTKLDAYLSYYLHFGATNASMSTLANGNALPIRCVRDELKK